MRSIMGRDRTLTSLGFGFKPINLDSDFTAATKKHKLAAMEKANETCEKRKKSCTPDTTFSACVDGIVEDFDIGNVLDESQTPAMPCIWPRAEAQGPMSRMLIDENFEFMSEPEADNFVDIDTLDTSPADATPVDMIDLSTKAAQGSLSGGGSLTEICNTVATMIKGLPAQYAKECAQMIGLIKDLHRKQETQQEQLDELVRKIDNSNRDTRQYFRMLENTGVARMPLNMSYLHATSS